jgi:hypothetical protein
MSETLNNEDRHHIHKSLMASLAFVSTLLLSTIAWAGGKQPAGETRAPSLSASAPVPFGPAEETSNETLGCGEAESCYASN